jgi:hypothetical protein
MPYFHIWIALDKASVTFKGLRYPGSLAWASDGAGTRDVRNWKGAIEAYDYTPSSRAEAYFRLGHVVHLLTDMAEPDHATNTPHAASGFAYPEDLNKILAFLKAAADDLPGFGAEEEIIRRVMLVNAARGQEKVGFEKFVEDNHAGLFQSPPQDKPSKRLSLENYFRTMGQLSRRIIREKSFPLPIGVRFTPISTEDDQRFLESPKANFSFFPAIDHRNPAEAERYLGLARELLTSAIRLNAGVIEFFHDIVNPPPYVRSVRISQGGRSVYHAYWRDIKQTVEGAHPNENAEAAKKLREGKFDHQYRYESVYGRELVGGPEERASAEGPTLFGARPGKRQTGTGPALRPGTSAEVRIEFGPDPAGFEAPPERMAEVTVAIGGRRVEGRLVDAGAAWVGSFTPVLAEGEEEAQLQIEIAGTDVHNHGFEGRVTTASHSRIPRAQGYALDKEPESPAKTLYDAGSRFSIKNYWPGVDSTHKVTVRQDEAPPPAEERAAAPSPGLSIGIVGDVVGPPGDRRKAWSFSVQFRAAADLELELVEVEQWQLEENAFNSYRRHARQAGRVYDFSAVNISDFSRPPDRDLERADSRLDDLALWPDYQDGVLTYVYHDFWVTAISSVLRYKIVCRARGPDGRVRQAELIFDSKDWVPTDGRGGRMCPSIARNDGQGSMRFERTAGRAAAACLLIVSALAGSLWAQDQPALAGKLKAGGAPVRAVALEGGNLVVSLEYAKNAAMEPQSIRRHALSVFKAVPGCSRRARSGWRSRSAGPGRFTIRGPRVRGTPRTSPAGGSTKPGSWPGWR